MIFLQQLLQNDINIYNGEQHTSLWSLTILLNQGKIISSTESHSRPTELEWLGKKVTYVVH